MNSCAVILWRLVAILLGGVFAIWLADLEGLTLTPWTYTAAKVAVLLALALAALAWRDSHR